MEELFHNSKFFFEGTGTLTFFTLMLSESLKAQKLGAFNHTSAFQLCNYNQTHDKQQAHSYVQGLRLVVVIVAVAMSTTHWIISHISIPIGGGCAIRGKK